MKLEMSEDQQESFGITVKTLNKNDDGSVDVAVQVTEPFKKWFMFMNKLESWDEDYFQKWFLGSLGDFIGENHETNDDSGR